jgi:hypothetical protein
MSQPDQKEPVCALCGWRQSEHTKKASDWRDEPGCTGLFLDSPEISERPESTLAALRASLAALKLEPK